MRPLVGITAWRRTLDTYYGPDRLQTLSTYYTDAVIDAGMTPIIYPAAQDPAETERLVNLVDGVVLSGGGDVDPSSYGAENTHSTANSPEVDTFELRVIEETMRQGKPLLAICRGLQIMNVAFGGTLNQEVTEEGGVHEPVTRDHVEMEARRHTVTFTEDSLMSGIYGATEAKVNTLHHQGVQRLADNLIAEGTTDDGLIEAARYDGDWWAVGVQWHPERMDGEHRRLFDAFLDEIRRSRET